MAGAVVQSPTYTVDDSGGNATTVVATITGVSAGNTIVAHVGWGNSGTVTCSGVNDGTAYASAAADVLNATDNQRGQVWYLVNAGSGSHTVTATFSATTGYRRLRLFEISGVLTASVVDQATGQAQNGVGTTTDSISSGNTATTTQANDFIMGFTQDTTNVDPGAGTMSAGTNFTLAGANQIMSAEFRSVSSTGAYAATFTNSANSNRITHIVAFKEAAAGAANDAYVSMPPLAPPGGRR